MVGGRDEPLNRPIRGEDDDRPSYAFTKSAEVSVLNLKNESSTNAFVEKFHWQFISLLYFELWLGRITPFKLVCFCSTHELSAVRDSAVRMETDIVKLTSSH